MTSPMNRYIDHAILRPEITRAEATAAIELGLRYNVRTVCVRPVDIELAMDLCRGTTVGVSTVLGFPHGSAMPASKADEASRYIDLGVGEIDMVMNYSLARSGLWEALEAEIRAVSGLTADASVTLKVILETSALDSTQIARATETAIACRAQFVKSSTGFGECGATVEAVAAMIRAASGRIQVKASGGIRDRASAQRFIDMGCTRLGVGYKVTPVICD